AFAGPLVAHQQTLGTNGGIPVLLGEAMIPTTLGGPRVWGDLLEVTGTFAASAAEDQGGPAVIAVSVRVLRTGTPVEPVPAGAQRVVAPLMGLLAAGLAAVAWRTHR
ncbi:MAG TPA: hypothetical protein VMM13_18470, partial [Euzebya sp.]|nr:hypothetical protein [Euzebya sp.]